MRKKRKTTLSEMEARLDAIDGVRRAGGVTTVWHACEALVRDLAQNGVRHDINPTIADRRRAVEFLYGYIRGIDERVRERAGAALRGEATA